MKICNVQIRIGGRYKPPGDTSTDDPPLHLKIEADTPEQLMAAEEHVRGIMGPMVEHAAPDSGPPLLGPPGAALPDAPSATSPAAPGLAPNPGVPQTFTALIDVGVPPESAYGVRGKLLGPKGSYLKHIQEQTGVKVQHAGKGSGNLTEDGKEKECGLSLALHAPR